MAQTNKGSAIPRFKVGDKVRVKPGVSDPDFEDIPLGGCSGTIEFVQTVEDQISYEIAWNWKTLKGMHPIYKKRCERDGLGLETIWLGDEDLEPDDGTHVPIEQPTKIKTPPLSENDQDDRVRKALGLTHDDPLPDVTRKTLLTYHRYLTANLKFPFNAYGEGHFGDFSRKWTTMIVTGLIDPQKNGLVGEKGLVCKARVREAEIEFPLADVEVRKKQLSFRLISDYAYWFHNWFCEDESFNDLTDDLLPIESQVQPPGLWFFTKGLLACLFGGAYVGGAIGAALMTLDSAGRAAQIGGIPLGIVGALMLGWYGSITGTLNRVRFGALLGFFFGSLGGGLVGVLAGLTFVTMPWSLLGLIGGTFLGPFVLPQEQPRKVSLRGASLGTCGGVFLSAFRHDQARAIAGAISGSITGLVVNVGLSVLIVSIVYQTPGVRMASSHKCDEGEFETVDEDSDDDHGTGLRLKHF